MCKKCGCNTCETDGTALMLNENKAPRTILSEGLKHHIDANKPLTDNFYTAGSRDYFDLIAEARSLYSRGILDFTNKRDIELLTETDQGHFGVYEGKKVPLDFPIELNEVKIGDTVKIDKAYGGGKGKIEDKIGSFVVINGESYHESDVELILDEAYSGFRRGEPEDPDYIPFKPTGSVSEFKEDLRTLFGKFKGDLKNPEFIKGVAQVMVNWKSLLRSQIELDEAKFKGKTVDLNKPTRGDSKKFKVYVNSGKKNADGSIKVKKVNFGHGGSSAKKAGQKTMSIRKSNPKARKAFRARHNCDNPGPKTMARYWSCKKW